jgi:hypothetical protein
MVHPWADGEPARAREIKTTESVGSGRSRRPARCGGDGRNHRSPFGMRQVGPKRGRSAFRVADPKSVGWKEPIRAARRRASRLPWTNLCSIMWSDRLGAMSIMGKGISRASRALGKALFLAQWCFVTYLIGKATGLLDWAFRQSGFMGLVGFAALLVLWILCAALEILAMYGISVLLTRLFVGSAEIKRREEVRRKNEAEAVRAMAQEHARIRAQDAELKSDPRMSACYGLLRHSEEPVFMFDEVAKAVASDLAARGMALVQGDYCRRLTVPSRDADWAGIGHGYVARVDGMLRELHGVGALRPSDKSVAFSLAASGMEAEDLAGAIVLWRKSRSRPPDVFLRDVVASARKKLA